MSLIPIKKCHICNSTFPDKVIFCSVCGTELIEEVNKPSESYNPPNSYDSPSSYDKSIEIPSKYPNSKKYFRDEPLETDSINGTVVADKTQYAWQVSEDLVPFRMKNQVSYADSYKVPKINAKAFKELSLVEYLILGSINTAISLSLILFSSIIILTTLKLVPTNWLSIFTTIILALIYFGLSYVNCFKTAQIISKYDNKPLKYEKSNLLSFSLIQVIHVGFISVISIFCMKLFFPSSDPISSPISIYVPSIVIVLLIALISPTFKTAKILSLVRNAGITQDFLDSIQFPKVGARRTLEVMVFSYLLPSVLIIAIFSPATHIVSQLLSSSVETNIASWEYILVILTMLLLSAVLAFTNFVDVNTFYFYEQSIKRYIAPPDLNWVKRVGSYTEQQGVNKSLIHAESFGDFEHELREERCPACSTELVSGAEFCTHCGKKIIR